MVRRSRTPVERDEAGAGAARALTPLGRVPASGLQSRMRSWVALVLVVVSVFAVLASALALWSRSIVFDTDAWVTTVAPAVEDPQARDAIGKYVASEVLAITDPSARAEDAPPPASREGLIAQEVDRSLDTELAQRLWAGGNRVTHEQLLAALQDEDRGVTVARTDVVLNLLPIVAMVLQRLEVDAPQLLGRDVRLPPIDPATAPDDIRALLQDAFGRELPADTGSITLLKGDRGYEAEQALRRLSDLAIPVIILTVVLIAAALLVSVRRRRTAIWLGLGALVGVVAARVIEAQVENAAVDAVKPQVDVAVTRSIVNSATGSLHASFVWIAVAGVIVAVAALLAGKPGWLDAMGRGFAGFLGVAAHLSTPKTRAGRWMAAHLDLLRVAGIAVALVVLLFATGSPIAVLAVVAALVFYELALSAYSGNAPHKPGDVRDGRSTRSV